MNPFSFLQSDMSKQSFWTHPEFQIEHTVQVPGYFTSQTGRQHTQPNSDDHTTPRHPQRGPGK